jgi:uncharacterized RDD family membrane protein YckC
MDVGASHSFPFPPLHAKFPTAKPLLTHLPMTLQTPTPPTLPKAQGVYYARVDQASFIVRILIDVLDVFVIILAMWIAWHSSLAMDATRDAALHLCIAIWIIYFVIVKWAARTLGYRAFGMKLVNLRGERAPLWSVMVRAGLMVLGPLNYLIDLLWMSTNANRQALRDQLLGTYVVKVKSLPIGTGPIIWENCHLMGYNFIVSEVKGSRAQ